MCSKKKRSIHDVVFSELYRHWSRGNKSTVIHNLSRRHPAIAAAFIVQGALDGILNLGDCNEITNRLMDDLIDVRDSFGITQTERKHQ